MKKLNSAIPACLGVIEEYYFHYRTSDTSVNDLFLTVYCPFNDHKPFNNHHELIIYTEIFLHGYYCYYYYSLIKNQCCCNIVNKKMNSRNNSNNRLRKNVGNKSYLST